MERWAQLAICDHAVDRFDNFVGSLSLFLSSEYFIRAILGLFRRKTVEKNVKIEKSQPFEKKIAQRDKNS